MFATMRYIEIGFGLNHWIVLLIGYIVFACIYWPLNKELKRRNEINYNSVGSRQ
jgi:hypothetical protein